MTERQKRGYDEAARGGPGVPPSDVGLPQPDEAGDGEAVDDRARRSEESGR